MPVYIDVPKTWFSLQCVPQPKDLNCFSFQGEPIIALEKCIGLSKCVWLCYCLYSRGGLCRICGMTPSGYMGTPELSGGHRCYVVVYTFALLICV